MSFRVQISDFKPLQELVENEQNIKTNRLKLEGNTITIEPHFSYKEDIDSENFLRIVFRCNGEEMVISWLFLLQKSKGTGTKIVQWFINYCKSNGYKVLKIATVKEDKVKMISICKKFDFVKKETSDEEYSDYYLRIKNM